MAIKKLTRNILIAAALTFLCAATSGGAKAADPDPAANPALAQLKQAGTKIYYLGKSAGLDGWFLIKENQVQVAYTSPDKQNVVFGVMLDQDEQNVTALQIKRLYDSNPEVKTLLTSLGNQPTAANPNMAMPGAQMPTSMPTPEMMAMAGAMPSMPTAAPNYMAPAAPTASPGERLLQSLQAAAGVNIGAAAAPQISMVVDPNCPHCHAAWDDLRSFVLGGKLQIRLVPIGAVEPDSERAAAQLLGTANPLVAWDKYLSGDHSQLAGTPDAVRLAAVRSNRALIDSWHIQMTPYIVYRAKDGQVKVVQGEPQKAATVINDITP